MEGDGTSKGANMWKVGKVQATDVPGSNDLSWGFNITNANSRPLVIFAYATEAEAGAAAKQVQTAIQKAILVKPAVA
jgi:hypothetical protein